MSRAHTVCEKVKKKILNLSYKTTKQQEKTAKVEIENQSNS